MTGWQVAKHAAYLCESQWIKAAELGRGPPYSRPTALTNLSTKSEWEIPPKIENRTARSPWILDPLEAMQGSPQMPRPGKATDVETKTAFHHQSLVSETHKLPTNEPLGGITSHVASGEETDDSWYSGNETDSNSLASEDISHTPIDYSARVLQILHQNKARVIRQIVQQFRKLIGSRESQTQVH